MPPPKENRSASAPRDEPPAAAAAATSNATDFAKQLAEMQAVMKVMQAQQESERERLVQEVQSLKIQLSSSQAVAKVNASATTQAQINQRSTGIISEQSEQNENEGSSMDVDQSMIPNSNATPSANVNNSNKNIPISSNNKQLMNEQNIPIQNQYQHAMSATTVLAPRLSAVEPKELVYVEASKPKILEEWIFRAQRMLVQQGRMKTSLEDQLELVRGTGKRNNVRFSCNQVNKTAKVIALRDINKGEEFFVSYGNNYWPKHKPIKQLVEPVKELSKQIVKQVEEVGTKLGTKHQPIIVNVIATIRTAFNAIKLAMEQLSTSVQGWPA